MAMVFEGVTSSELAGAIEESGGKDGGAWAFVGHAESHSARTRSFGWRPQSSRPSDATSLGAVSLGCVAQV